MPLLSVVLPVYNTEQHIKEAISSVLNQTMTDFELIIMDDRSTDGTAEIIHSMKDARIRYVRNEVNLGRAGSDNAALAYVHGKYIARMDGDDICHPRRFEKQVHLLDEHPSVNVTGGWMQNFGAGNYLNRYPATPELARCRTLFTLPVGNPTVMQRSSLFTEMGMHYDAALRQSEDYDFFSRYIDQLSVQSIQETLLQYRTYNTVAKEEVLQQRAASAADIRKGLLQRWGIGYSERDLEVHNALADMDLISRLKVTTAEAETWLEKLLAYNQQQPLFDFVTLAEELSERWFHFCYHSSLYSTGAIKNYYKSALAQNYRLSFGLKAKFLLKSFKSMIG